MGAMALCGGGKMAKNSKIEVVHFLFIFQGAFFVQIALGYLPSPPLFSTSGFLLISN